MEAMVQLDRQDSKAVLEQPDRLAARVQLDLVQPDLQEQRQIWQVLLGHKVRLDRRAEEGVGMGQPDPLVRLVLRRIQVQQDLLDLLDLKE